MNKKVIPKSVNERLPVYLHYLNTLKNDESSFISSTKISNALNLGEVLVRKDLALISGSGRPKLGYVKDELIAHLKEALGTSVLTKVVIVGAGKLGLALMDYDGFEEYGYKIVAAFDNDLAKIDNQKIFPLSSFKNFCIENDIKIGIVTVPEKHAQEICDLMVDAKIQGIWNFSPINLVVPNNIIVKNENMAASLVVLSSKIYQ